MSDQNIPEQPESAARGCVQRVVMKRTFELIEAMEAQPHIGMSDSKKLWKAYANLTRSLGGSPMTEWWKDKKLHNEKLTRTAPPVKPE